MAIATDTINAQRAQCAQNKIIAFSWNPGVNSSDTRYRVYFGTDSNSFNTLAFDLSISTRLDSSALDSAFCSE